MSMGFRRVRPTKPNLDKLVKKREFSKRGSHLLELKRQQILNNFRRYMKEYVQQRRKTREKIIKAYRMLNECYMHYGKRRIKLISAVNKIHYEPKIELKFVNYLGVNVPKIKLDLFEKEKLPSYSFQDTPLIFDDLVNQITDLMKDIVRLAELDYLIFHLIATYQKIQRRIKALDQIIIPNLDRQIKGIEEVLEDLEREEHIQMKEIKEKIRIKEEG